METESRKKGFAMLEVMIIIMVFMVLAASLFASAGAIHSRAVKRTNNNEAYYAALAAVKLMAGEVMNDENGVAAVTLTSGLDETETVISITTKEGTSRSIPVKIFSKAVGNRYLTLTAKAEVGGQTENVSLTLQNRKTYVPDYPYGCGLMGKVDLKVNSSITAGPDVDVYLTGYTDIDKTFEGIKAVGGNLVIDGGRNPEGEQMRLKRMEVGGMIIANDDISLELCVVGNSKDKNSGRRGGIYTTGTLSLTNCDIYGDVYANTFVGNGEENIFGEYGYGSLNYVNWDPNNYVVWDSERQSVNTSKPEYRRNSFVRADGGYKKIIDASGLKDYLPKKEDVFVPRADERNGMKICRVDSGSDVFLDELVDNSGQEAGDPVEHVIYMEENSRLIIWPNGKPIFNVYVYGKGKVEINGDVTIYGGLQADSIIISNSELKIFHGEPKDPAMKTPSSAVGFKSWVPLDYNMNPSLED